jgi:toxin ParE1/3/4
MNGFILSPAAEEDLGSIWRYTADAWSIKQADSYVLEIRSTCVALGSGENAGRPIEDVRRGYSKITVGSHFIVYKITNGFVNVVRILHQRMDIAAQLKV